MTRSELIRIFRRSQTFISILIFFFVFLFSWHITGFQLTEIQLSKWGEGKSVVKTIWNSALCLLSISVFLNTLIYLKYNNRIRYKIIPYILFGFISFCLLFIGLFSIDHKFIHNLAAYLYFFAYPLSIFIFAHINRKTLLYKDWIHHVGLSLSMIVVPLILLTMFNGMALSEISHIIFVVIWNLKIAFKSILDI